MPEALFLYMRACARAPAGIRWLRQSGHSLSSVVYAVATARLVRRMQRIPGSILSAPVVWSDTIPSSCVIAFFHSPWDRLIVREVVERRYCLVRAGREWAETLGKQYVAWNRAGLRSLVRGTGMGPRCAAAMDNFVVSEEPGFLGAAVGPSPAPVRLAAAAGVALVPVWLAYERGVVRVDTGAPIAASICAERPTEALRLAREFFENAVLRDPAGWRRILRFLELRR